MNIQEVFFVTELIAIALLFFKIILNRKYYFQTGSFWFFLFFIVSLAFYRVFLYCAPQDKFFGLIRNILCIGTFTYLEKFYYKETSNTKQKSAFINLKRRQRILTSFSICSIANLVTFALMICLYPIYTYPDVFSIIVITLILIDMIIFALNSTQEAKPLFITFMILEITARLVTYCSRVFGWTPIIIGPISVTIKILQTMIILYNVFVVREVKYERID